MHRPGCLVLACVLATAAQSATAETHPFSVHDMQSMLRLSDPRVSPDGKLVAFTVAETDFDADKRRSDLYLADTGGTWTRRLTSDPANDTSPRWSADGSALYFLSSRAGSQQVWRLPLDGGEAEPVTSLPLDVGSLEVVPGGGALVLSMAVFPGRSPEATRDELAAREKSPATGRIYDKLFIRHWDTWEDGTRNHLFFFPLPGGPARDLMPAMDADCPTKPFGGNEDFCLSPDGKTLVFSARDVGREEAWSTNFDLFEVPLDHAAEPRRLTTNLAWDAQPQFSPDGRTLGWLAMDRPGFESDRFHFVFRKAGTTIEHRLDVGLGGAHGDRSPNAWAWSRRGDEVVWSADHLGQRALFATETKSGKSRILVGQGTVVAPQPMPAGRVLYGMNSLLGPTELYTVGMRDRRSAAVTRMNAERVAAARFGTPEQFRFVGAHGDSIYGWIVKPVDFQAGRKYPVAFIIHGGPQGSMGNDFHYRWNPQAYAGAGYAAVFVDFHGSTGYGQAFTDAIRGDWGGAPYEDLMTGLDVALQRYPFLDGDRVGALGASFGAYMINWIAGKTDRFKCFVTHDGNLDELTAYYDTEELWFPEWEHGGVPWEHPEGYTTHSPITLVQNWKTPALVVHGGKDFRVVETQGFSVFTALQRRGVPSKLLYFPNENHWVLAPANSILWHETVIGWLDQWLQDRTGARR